MESNLQCGATVDPVAAAPHQQCASQLQEQAVDAVKHHSVSAQGNVEGGVELLAGDMGGSQSNAEAACSTTDMASPTIMVEEQGK